MKRIRVTLVPAKDLPVAASRKTDCPGQDIEYAQAVRLGVPRVCSVRAKHWGANDLNQNYQKQSGFTKLMAQASPGECLSMDYSSSKLIVNKGLRFFRRVTFDLDLCPV